jgi:hypothetical protein
MQKALTAAVKKMAKNETAEVLDTLGRGSAVASTPSLNQNVGIFDVLVYTGEIQCNLLP